MTSSPVTLTDRVRALVLDAAAACAGTSTSARLLAQAARLDEPLRVALVGATKAGKSTLVNALVGERVAATDAAECTRVVTTYEHGRAAQAWAHPLVGSAFQVPFRHEEGRTTLDLGGADATGLRSIAVTVPSAALQVVTLVDTPGVGSLSAGTSQRTLDYVAGTDTDRPDAVVVLLRHLDDADVGFLDPFHDAAATPASAVNAVGVLSRADELAPGRTDSSSVAEAVAARHRDHPALRARVSGVLPVSGLLAETGATVREDEFAAVARLAALDVDDADRLLRSVDDLLVPRPVGGPDVDPVAVRSALLDRFGLGGLRLCVVLVGSGVCPDAAALAAELVRRSGIDALRSVVVDQFAGRAEVLRAATALDLVAGALDGLAPGDAERVRLRAEQITVSAHEFAELRLLEAIRTGTLGAADDGTLAGADTVLGGRGTEVRSRLGLAPDAGDEEVDAALWEQLQRWRRVAEHPFVRPDVRRAAQVLRRTCEGLAAARR